MNDFKETVEMLTEAKEILGCLATEPYRFENLTDENAEELKALADSVYDELRQVNVYLKYRK